MFHLSPVLKLFLPVQICLSKEDVPNFSYPYLNLIFIHFLQVLASVPKHLNYVHDIWIIITQYVNCALFIEHNYSFLFEISDDCLICILCAYSKVVNVPYLLVAVLAFIVFIYLFLFPLNDMIGFNLES